MRLITINPVLDMETLEWVSNDGVYQYSGPLDLCLGGATSGEKGIATDEETFLQNMQNEQQTQFQNEQTAQNQIQQAWSPIVAGGAYQYGFSTAEDEQLRGNIVNAGATATENTENAAQLRQQQATGGAGGGPAGGQAALDAQIAATGAQQTATNLGQEKELGYETGRQLFEQGTQAEEAVADLSNPNAYAKSANSAAGEAMQGQQALDTANANSLLSKVVGGAVGAIPGVGSSIAEGLQGGGGLSDVVSSVAGGLCWIASAVFDEPMFGPRVSLVRKWLLDIEPLNAATKFVVGLYRRYGKQAAKAIGKNRVLKSAFRSLFDRVLAKAEAKYKS